MLTVRVITVAALAAVDSLLWRLVRPDRGEAKAVLMTAGTAAACDFLVEFLMRRFRFWEYRMKGSVAGMPVDLAPDFFMVVTAFCLGLVRCSRSAQAERARWVYVTAVLLLVGAEAYLKNRGAALDGYLVFGRGIDTESTAFAYANFFVIGVALASIAVLFTMLSRRLREEEGG